MDLKLHLLCMLLGDKGWISTIPFPGNTALALGAGILLLHIGYSSQFKLTL